MEATELKRRLIDYINNADEEVLKDIQALVENHEKDQVVAYTVEGKPLNKQEFQKEIAEAEAEYEKGNFKTHEQLKKEVKTWKK